MYDIHVGDEFENKNGKVVRVVLIDIDGKIQYEFVESGAKRWMPRADFLSRFPIPRDN